MPIVDYSQAYALPSRSYLPRPIPMYWEKSIDPRRWHQILPVGGLRYDPHSTLMTVQSGGRTVAYLAGPETLDERYERLWSEIVELQQSAAERRAMIERMGESQEKQKAQFEETQKRIESANGTAPASEGGTLLPLPAQKWLLPVIVAGAFFLLRR